MTRHKGLLEFLFALPAIGIVLTLLIAGIIGAVCFTYAFNTWLVYFGKEPSFLWWYGLILGYIPYIGELALPIAAITFICTFFI